MNKTQDILKKNSEVILEELGIKNLSPEDKTEVLKKLESHFNDVIIEAVVSSLNDRQIEEFRSALGKENFEEEITKITASVPGLAEKIEKAVESEFAVLKEGYKNIS